MFNGEHDMKKALIDPEGRIAQVEFEELFPVEPPMAWVDCPDDCLAYAWTYSEGVFSPPDQAGLLDMAKAAKFAQIERDRDAACVANVAAHGRIWQADARSQALLGQAITLASAGLPLPAYWRDYENSDMAIESVADLLAIAGAIAAQVQVAYATSWARKAAVDMAETVDGVDAV